MIAQRIAIAVAVAFGLLCIASPPIGYADPDDPPGISSNPLVIPDDSETPVDRSDNNNPKEVWFKIDEEHGPVSRIKIVIKDTEEKHHKITFKRIRKLVVDPGTGQPEMVDILDEYSPTKEGSSAHAGTASTISSEPRELVVRLDPPAMPGDLVQIDLTVELLQGSDGPVSLNVREDTVQDAYFPGPQAPDSVLNVYSGLEINVGPTQVDLLGTPGTFDAPDLAFAESAPVRLQTGALTFTPLANAAFTGTPTAVAVDLDQGIVVNDVTRIELGTLSIVDGRVVLEVLHRDPNDSATVAIVVQNVEIDLPQFSAPRTVRYAVGGTAASRLRTSAASLLTVGVPAGGQVVLDSVGAEIGLGGGETGFWRVGSDLWVVAADQTQQTSGYLSGFVLTENAAGVFGDGTIEFRPLDDFAITSDAETKVYVFDADTGEALQQPFGTISYSAGHPGGSARLTLDNRLEAGRRLRIVVGNVKVDLGAGPYTGRNMRVGIGGSAGMSGQTITFAEGTSLHPAIGQRSLPSDPFDFVNWTPVQ